MNLEGRLKLQHYIGRELCVDRKLLSFLFLGQGYGRSGDEQCCGGLLVRNFRNDVQIINGHSPGAHILGTLYMLGFGY